MTVSSIQAGGGGDYTTIQSWANDANVSSSTWEGSIDDTNSYAAWSISSVTGTPSSTNYVWLYAGASYRHSGVTGTGHARITNSTAGTHCCQIGVDYTRISWLEIIQSSTGVSDEGIRISSGVDNALVSYCIIRASGTVSDQDGIYTGNYSCSVTVDHCIIYNFQRAGLHAQCHTTSTATQTWNIDFCTSVGNGAVSQAESGGINARLDNAGSSLTINVYSTFCGDTGSTYQDFSASGAASGSITWAGTNNGCTDTSLTSRGLTTGAQESLNTADTTKSSGSWAVFNSLTTPDYRLLDGAAGNLLYNNGTARTPADTRQSFSTDIAGNSRPQATSYDIGAHEYTAGGGSSNNPWYYYAQAA